MIDYTQQVGTKILKNIYKFNLIIKIVNWRIANANTEVLNVSFTFVSSEL